MGVVQLFSSAFRSTVKNEHIREPALHRWKNPTRRAGEGVARQHASTLHEGVVEFSVDIAIITQAGQIALKQSTRHTHREIGD
jgi:hypothetical protein